MRFLRLPLGGATVVIWGLQFINNISSPDGGGGGVVDQRSFHFFPELELSWIYVKPALGQPNIKPGIYTVFTGYWPQLHINIE